MDIVAEFMSRYRREFDFYDQVARLTAQRLETLLQSAGIRAIVTGREKNQVRLEAKVRQRLNRRSYNTVDDVYKDIIDLAGARVALYFPGDHDAVEKLIRANFDVPDPPKRFPEKKAQLSVESQPASYMKRFSGYWATHYRIRLPESSLSEAQRRYSEARVEVQVASVLMHAWSEVEHDLVYKPLGGPLSESEYAILDELNGLVMAGEIALERLQKAVEARVTQKDREFGSHFDLAAYLFEVARPILRDAPDDAALGRIDLLYALSQRLHLNTPGKLSPFVKNLHADTDRRPIADQIIDQILGDDPKRYSLYRDLRSASDMEDAEVESHAQPPDVRNAMGVFIDSWVQFEKAVRSLSRAANQRIRPIGDLLRSVDIGDAKFDIERIRRIRNALVHGIEVPDSDTLASAAQRLDEITRGLRKRRPKKP